MEEEEKRNEWWSHPSRNSRLKYSQHSQVKKTQTKHQLKSSNSNHQTAAHGIEGFLAQVSRLRVNSISKNGNQQTINML